MGVRGWMCVRVCDNYVVEMCVRVREDVSVFKSVFVGL